jgi:hypothetical protein
VERELTRNLPENNPASDLTDFVGPAGDSNSDVGTNHFDEQQPPAPERGNSGRNPE